MSLDLRSEPVYKTAIVTIWWGTWVRKSGSSDSSMSLDLSSDPRVQDSECHCMMRNLSDEVQELGLYYEPGLALCSQSTRQRLSLYDEVPEWGSPAAQTPQWTLTWALIPEFKTAIVTIWRGRYLSEEVRELGLLDEPGLALWAGVQDSECHYMLRYLSEEVR